MELVEKPLKSNNIFARQAAHSAEVSDMHYAVNMEDLADCTARAAWEFLVASLHWHQFLRADPEDQATISSAQTTTANESTPHGEPAAQNTPPNILVTPPPSEAISTNTQPPVLDNSITNTVPTSKGINILTLTTVRQPNFILKGLLARHGHVFMKSHEQAFPVSQVVAGDPPLLVILPTGGGKTDIWLLPLYQPNSPITVVLTLLVFLTAEVITRTKAAGHMVWTATDFKQQVKNTS